MNYEEAKKAHAEGKKVYRAYYDGRVWNAGRMVDVGETLGYYLTKAEARKECDYYEMFDFDKKNCYTDVELCDDGEFMEA